MTKKDFVCIALDLAAIGVFMAVGGSFLGPAWLCASVGLMVTSFALEMSGP